MIHRGFQFLQIPGPTNVPERILRAMARPTIDHRGPEFQRLISDLLPGLQEIFKTVNPVVVFPASGTGAWEAALVNTLSAGDHVLMYETGHFATLWHQLAQQWGLVSECLPGDWRSGVDAGAIEAKLSDDADHQIKAVCVVHNETSTGVTSDIAAVRAAIDNTNHPGFVDGRYDLISWVDGIST